MNNINNKNFSITEIKILSFFSNKDMNVNFISMILEKKHSTVYSHINNIKNKIPCVNFRAVKKFVAESEEYEELVSLSNRLLIEYTVKKKLASIFEGAVYNVNLIYEGDKNTVILRDLENTLKSIFNTVSVSNKKTLDNNVFSNTLTLYVKQSSTIVDTLDISVEDNYSEKVNVCMFNKIEFYEYIIKNIMK